MARPVPFRVDVPTDVLTDPGRPWRTGFDWQARQQVLNRHPRFLVEIDSRAVHFPHVRGGGPAPFPLLLTHGRPSTCWEFLPLVQHPSLPGFAPSAPAPNATMPAEPAAEPSIRTAEEHEFLGRRQRALETDGAHAHTDRTRPDILAAAIDKLPGGARRPDRRHVARPERPRRRTVRCGQQTAGSRTADRRAGRGGPVRPHGTAGMGAAGLHRSAPVHTRMPRGGHFPALDLSWSMTSATSSAHFAVRVGRAAGMLEARDGRS